MRYYYASLDLVDGPALSLFARLKVQSLAAPEAAEDAQVTALLRHTGEVTRNISASAFMVKMDDFKATITTTSYCLHETVHHFSPCGHCLDVNACSSLFPASVLPAIT